MLFRSFGLCATFALAAHAVMVPPTVSIESLSDDNSIETLGVDAFKQSIKLECPDCPMASGEKTFVWKQGIENSLVIDFAIGQNQDTLDIGGVQLYPPSFGHFADPFYVSQVASESDSDSKRLRITGYALNYNTAETISEAGTELLPMTFKITSIESHSISPSALTIFLLKDVSGHLMIASISPASAAAESSPKEETKECKEWSFLCKWKSIISDKIEGVKTKLSKGCHKGNPMRPGGHGKPPHRAHPGRPHHHPHHHGKHHSHRMAFVRKILFTFVFPIIIGTIAGAFVYILGMAIGRFIAFMWWSLRGRTQYESVAQDEEEGHYGFDGKGSDKEVYCEPPVYEGVAPPVYEEAAEKEVVDESN
ncbi:uncharacterized protein K441DRAFT_702755 [Cenococcum geophilum 1.58]|uniref:uncharacterized protein n=1 Tax=Cenococcum geophilum 1.58 TaxID=794803 RepID=UPI0035903031|nr:hypothetical protein K441DRAFT_702755 [Cenococcum geophilum 1.58]